MCKNQIPNVSADSKAQNLENNQKRKKRTNKEILSVYYNREIVPCHVGEITDIAFVFSCPGKKELEKYINFKKTSTCKVCKRHESLLAGDTGKNLDKLLVELNKINPTIFNSTDRYKYLLANASCRVHYKGYNVQDDIMGCKCCQNDTEACLCCLNTEVDNLHSKLQNAKYIVFFGEKANIIKDKLSEKDQNHYQSIKIAQADHLSNKVAHKAYLNIAKDICKQLGI